jgi:hemolysin III
MARRMNSLNYIITASWLNWESGMAASRSDTSAGSISLLSGTIIPYPERAVLPPHVTGMPQWIRYFYKGSSFFRDIALSIQEKTQIRESMSGLTHFIGAILSTVGLTLLIMETARPLRPWHFATFMVFGLSMIALYTASTMFHWLPLSKEWILKLRKLDHIMIFIFMAATYTPFCLIPFRGVFGWSIFISIWIIAGLGAVFKLYWINVSKKLCISIYLFAGFFSLTATGHIVNLLQPWAIFWLAAGGLSYMIGVSFYALEKSVEKTPFFGYHELFHIFVMLGSTAHFWVIYRYIILFN